MTVKGLGRSWMCLGFALLVGCESGLTEADRHSLAQASQEVERGQVNPALPRLNRIISEHANAPEAAEAYYLRGLCRARLNQVQPAALDFMAAIDRAERRRELLVKARASLAEIYFGWGNWVRAADLYAQAVDGLEDRPPADQILYAAGVAMQRAGRWPTSRLQFARILSTPALRAQPIARDAYLKYKWPYDYFSIQLGAFADADKAGTVARSFKERGVDAWEELRQGANPRFWIVLTGRYATYAEVVAALPRVQRYQADACIVP